MAVVQRSPGTSGTSDQSDHDADLLFREAKQRERRRRLAWFGAVVIAVGTLTAIIAVTRSTPNPPPHLARASSPRVTKVAAAAGAIVTPEHPYGMAVGSGGTLYVMDSGRDQVLRLKSNGQFQVIAGDGKRGFSGDGGQAVDAAINIESDSGIAVARNGTVYFADTSNGRVREVLPDGIIETVVGGGSRTIAQGALPARQVSLSKQFTVNGVAIGPGGDLYVAAGPVYRLERNGLLQWVVGKRTAPPKDWLGVYANPAVQLDFASSYRIAFDGKGDLLDAGGGGWGLYERTAAGGLRFIENFRGDGAWGSLAPTPNGSVALVSGSGLSLFNASGALSNVPSSGLSAALGLNAFGHQNAFIGGDGIAVAPSGAVYVDTNTGNTFTSVSAILTVNMSGQVEVVWKS